MERTEKGPLKRNAKHGSEHNCLTNRILLNEKNHPLRVTGKHRLLHLTNDLRNFVRRVMLDGSVPDKKFSFNTRLSVTRGEQYNVREIWRQQSDGD